MGQVWVKQSIPGLFTVGRALTQDSRGSFHKIWCEAPAFVPPMRMDEIYWSQSRTGVARGMHFQVPPHEGRKLVFATAGKVRDMVIDLRIGSPTHGLLWEMDLSPESPGVFIPAGCAHGFETLEGPATLVYVQEGNYNVECDTGVSILSIGAENDLSHCEMSERDRQLPTVDEFESPFFFEESLYPNWLAQ